MKILGINHFKSTKSQRVRDCLVGEGYYKANHGSLPDVDIDFQADRRPEIKAYLEKRYNKNGMQRVFSAGTFTTIKIKSAIKDICRVHRIPVGTTNYITAMIDKDNISWTDFMRLTVKEKKIKDFVEKYPDVFEEILPLMEQARSAGIHASAVIITPEYVKGRKVDCFDLLPIRKMDGMLVSELSGYDIDALGILKNDVLAIQELTRLADMLALVKQQYGANYTTLDIVTNHGDDPKVLKLISNGYTQGVFQMSGDGITRFIKRMKPDSIKDIIALVALFRPGPLDTGAAEAYCDIKNNPEIEPTYLWGTQETLGKTYGQIVYQEQIAELARKIGGLSLGEGVNLVKAISKKKIDKVNKFKDKFFKGAKANGCPKEAASEIWDSAEKFAAYAFNSAHATAYGLTAYIGAWIKTYYPTPFYTVVLRDVDEDKLPAVMSEMERMGGAKLCQPDINISGRNFVPDYENNQIYWSLARVKWVGLKTVDFIIREREMFGDFTDMEEFIRRIFRQKLVKFKNWDDPADGVELEKEKCAVTARHVRMLIYAGAFDRCDHIESICDRYELLKKAANILGFEISEKEIPEGMEDKPYFWAQQQRTYSGFGSVDYKALWDGVEKTKYYQSMSFIDFKDLERWNEPKGVTAATIIEVRDRTYKSYKDGSTQHFGKITLQQNIHQVQLTVWGAAWEENKHLFIGKEGAMIAVSVSVKYSDYDGKNVLRIGKGGFIKQIE